MKSEKVPKSEEIPRTLNRFPKLFEVHPFSRCLRFLSNVDVRVNVRSAAEVADQGRTFQPPHVPRLVVIQIAGLVALGRALKFVLELEGVQKRTQTGIVVMPLTKTESAASASWC